MIVDRCSICNIFTHMGDAMYIYYVLRGTRQGSSIEHEDDLTPEHFSEETLTDGPTLISQLVSKLASEGITGEWSECDLTNDFFDREDHYLFYEKRWIRRSETPWRRDK